MLNIGISPGGKISVRSIFTIIVKGTSFLFNLCHLLVEENEMQFKVFRFPLKLAELTAKLGMQHTLTHHLFCNDKVTNDTEYVQDNSDNKR